MSIFEAILIGLVQGLTEFLPISSSGHTILVGKLLGLEVDLSFELLIHMASLLAVIIVLNKPIVGMLKRPFSKQSRLIIVATIPTIAVFLLFKNFFEASFGGELLAISFLVSALFILLSGLKREFKPSGQMGYFDALVIGTIQGLAGMPGLSRSGSTISTSIMLGNSKKESAQFSFLLSIPIIVGSFVVEFVKAIKSNTMSLQFLPAFFGFLSAFVFGLIALRFMINRLNKYFDYFAIYLLALSLFLFLDNLFLHWL